MTNKYLKIKVLAIAMLVFLVAPLSVQAAVDSGTTTVNANLGSTISLTTAGPVTLNVTPVAGGSQTSASDTVSVSTNNSTGYNLTIENSDANTGLVNGSDEIDAHAGNFASPSALANNSWGYAVAGTGSFDGSYSALDNVTSSASLWAGIPANGDGDTIKTTADTASGDNTTVWFSVKADTSKPNGTYTDTVTYTATTNN